MEGAARARSDGLNKPRASKPGLPRERAAGLLDVAAELAAEGVAFALVTVVRAVAPTSGKPGDKAILTEQGEWFGWVGGSCAEPAARRAARAALADGECRLLQVTNDARDEARAGVEIVAMSCYSGGSLEIYVEPHLPGPSLVVFGGSPIARALCDLGAALGYRPIRVDPEHGAEPSAGRCVQALADLPEPGKATFVVVASHGRGEEEALAWALTRPAAYVGLVTSRKRLLDVRDKLAALGVTADQLARLHAPAGLRIGATGAQEIALSVLAEIVAERRGAAAAAPHAAAEIARSEAPAAPAAGAVDARSCCDVEPAAGEAAHPPRAARPEARAARRSCCDVEEPVLDASERSAPSAVTFSAVVLAAGLSRRMGAPNKLLLPLAGQVLITHVVSTVLAAGFAEVVVVLGHQAEDVRAALAPLGVRTVFNPEFESGQVSSVRTGLRALQERSDGVMMCLGDQPLLTTEDLRALMSAFATRPAGSIVVPMYGGERGNPVVIDRATAEATLTRAANFGCRHFIDENPDRVHSWMAPNDHFVRDVDRPAEYQAMLLQTSPAQTP